MRDVRRISKNLKTVLLPSKYGGTADGPFAPAASAAADDGGGPGAAARAGARTVVADWDLWGPAVVCLLLAACLSTQAAPDKAGAVFSLVFGSVAGGAFVVSATVGVLGGDVPLLGSAALLGYCSAPLAAAAVLGLALRNVALRVLLSLGAAAWSAWATVPFAAGVVPRGRRALAAYPALLLYLWLAWLVMVE